MKYIINNNFENRIDLFQNDAKKNCKENLLTIFINCEIKINYKECIFISNIFKKLSKLKSRISINLTNSKSDLPVSINRIVNLEELILSNNHLTKISIEKLINLKSLSIINNPIIYQNIEHLKNIKSLKLYGCSLYTLPDSFESLKNLRNLDIGGNLFTILPNVIFKLNLERLDLSNNEMKILNFSKLINLKNLKYLNLTRNFLTTFPDLPVCLEELNISHNYFKELPFSIIKFTKLKKLNLGGSCLKISYKILYYIDLNLLNFDRRDIFVGKLSHNFINNLEEFKDRYTYKNKSNHRLYFLLCKLFNSEILRKFLKSNIYKILINLIKF